MTIHLAGGAVTLHHGDCREVLAGLEDASISSIVTDPPYELGFMGKAWDASGIAYNVEMWRECLRVLKPGGHLLAFGGTRTYHRMAAAIEDAGFEIRDSIHWLYGSGFPKSLDVSKAIDKAAGAEREVGRVLRSDAPKGHSFAGETYGEGGLTRVILRETFPATDAAKQWDGWGTALKPAHEPVVMARKPLIGTVAANVLQHGTGALNIDGCRVGTTVETWPASRAYSPYGTGNAVKVSAQPTGDAPSGRWPANIVFTHAAECQQIGTKSDAFNVVDGFRDYPQDSNFGARAQVTQKLQSVEVPVWECVDGCPVAALDAQSGGASWFFTVTEWSEIDVPFRYVAKPSKQERNAGLDGLPEKTGGEATGRADNSAGINSPRAGAGRTGGSRNFHPTVKPVELMRWLIRLVTPPDGVVLDPFAGSGTTLVAAVLEGFGAVGIELTEEYLPIITGRVTEAHITPQQLDLFGGVA